MEEGEVAPGLPRPTNAMELTEETQQVVVQALEQEGFKHILVFLIRGQSWERWLLGALTTTPDDMVRWICGRLGPPDGVATAEAALALVGGRRERVVRIVGEMGGHRVERVMIMVPKPGKPEDVVPGRSMVRELGPVPEGEGWIGVEPMLAGPVTTRRVGHGQPE